MGKLALNTAQRQRDVEGCIIENWTIEEEHMIPKAMAKTGELYAHRKREEAMEVDGQPHIHKYMAMIETMVEWGKAKQDQTEDLKKALIIITTHGEDLGKLASDQVAEIISMCKVKTRNDRPGRQKEVRILFNINLTSTGRTSVSEVDVLKAVKVVLSSAGGTRSNGAVAPSILERNVSNWVTDRAKGKGKGKY